MNINILKLFYKISYKTKFILILKTPAPHDSLTLFAMYNHVFAD